ncbi:creatininase family protein [Longimicrobium terrae]|uniref:Creatinine amidohydrolase n=1 Tax=Longimicrobium terrae TaxID=1639882 RepID=A0A841H6X6_9BACT|nr:creatinine amidohydrolase [Longimicrobium terrae]MBB6073911.1 creatinine amidohydrolase [Longimicrobium terrae]NNC30108.1 creatininase family protein [Longimicrobium terrae]
MPRPWILAETNWKAVRDTAFDVAVLPWGATEAHNYHLPYATDVIQCDHVAAEAARLAWERGARVAVLPTVPFGVQAGQLDIPFCLNLNPSTQALVLRDLVMALAGQGVRRLVILNGHGGNDFRAMLRELQPVPGIFLCAINWWNCVDPRPFFAAPGDHAGELETSVMMHIAPDLVLPLEEAGDGSERKSRLAGVREGWAWAPRRWTAISSDTGVGDPSQSAAEKGAAFLAAVTERISGFLVEFASLDPDDAYQSEAS